MDVELWQTIKQLFETAPPGVQVTVLAVLVLLLVGSLFWGMLRNQRVRELEGRVNHLGREEKALRKQLSEYQQLLDGVIENEVHVWERPPANRPAEKLPLTVRNSRFVAICNLKGGVGKTTTAANLGAVAALQGRTTLLIDIDFQGSLSNRLASDSGLLAHSRQNGWTSELLFDERGTALDHAIKLEALGSADLLAARELLETVDFQLQARQYFGKEPDVRFLHRSLLHRAEVTSRYEIVIWDCPPRLTTSCVNAIGAADLVLLPAHLTVSDVEAIPRTLHWLHKISFGLYGLPKVAVMISGAQAPRMTFTREEQNLYHALRMNLDASAKEGFVVHLLNSFIPTRATFQQAERSRQPAVALDTEIQRAYRSLLREVLQVI